VDWNPYEFNYPLRYLGLLDKPEYKIMVLVLAVEYRPGRKTDFYGRFLGWSNGTVSKWAETANELGLLDVRKHSLGAYKWHTYHLAE